jgi:lysophospholipase L1-like esterase
MRAAGWLILLILLIGCSGTTMKDKGSAKSDTFFALGDSYTIGEAVANSERWPTVLANRLREQGINISEPLILAKTGWTTDELQNALDASKQTGLFPMVTLMIGVNDQYRRRKPEEFGPHFMKLLDRAISLAEGKPDHVLVISIPDYGYMPHKFGPQNISQTIDQFNEIIRKEASQRGSVFIDVTSLSRDAKTRPELRAADGLHFSAIMHQQWADLIYPHAAKILGPAN